MLKRSILLAIEIEIWSKCCVFGPNSNTDNKLDAK